MSCIAGLTQDGHFYLNTLLDNSYNLQKINNLQVFFVLFGLQLLSGHLQLQESIGQFHNLQK